MAREESQREDLMAEAKALTQRLELSVEGFDVPLVMGFRREGAVSIYLGNSLAYHFNSTNELRRAYLEPFLIKAERGRLVSLQRQRSSAETTLARDTLDDARQAAFLHDCGQVLKRLSSQLAAGRFHVLRQAPPDGRVVDRVRKWLDQLGSCVMIAQSPRVR